jgi:mono/diheme cytochrome c family protein
MILLGRSSLPRWRDLALGTIVCAGGTFGCVPAEPPRFTPSAETKALTANLETEEDKKLLTDLQNQCIEQLAKHCGTPLEPKPIEGSGLSEDRLVQGAEVFARRCQPCHGTNGDGNGAVSQYLRPLPRDYTKGVFKFTSTPYGSKPLRSDLSQTIRRGVIDTSMPSFSDLPPEELEAVVDYVIYLSQRGELERELASIAEQEESLSDESLKDAETTVVERWQEAQPKLVTPLTPMPLISDDTIAKGKELFLKQACNKCHGTDGRGGSFGVDVGKDVWGHEAAAADLTSGMYRGGGRPIDIYRRIYSGINGTPMPSFAQVFDKSPDDIWYLVHFIRDLGERRRRNLPPLSPSTTPGGTEQPAEESAPQESTNQAASANSQRSEYSALIQR